MATTRRSMDEKPATKPSGETPAMSWSR